LHKYQIKEQLISELKTICSNVEKYFDHPVRRTEAQGDFPYITVVWRDWRPEAVGQIRGVQTCDIIGIVYGETEDLEVKLSELETAVIGLLYKNELRNNIVSVDNSNLFLPFGIQAGVFPPYAGFRIEVNLANVKLT
jgi:hypothetical protein